MWYLHEEGRVLSFDMSLHCRLKNSLNILVFSKKLVTSLASTSKGGIIGTFLPLSIVQYIFAEVKDCLTHEMPVLPSYRNQSIDCFYFERFYLRIIYPCQKAC